MKEEIASPPPPYLSEVPSAEFLFVHLSTEGLCRQWWEDKAS